MAKRHRSFETKTAQQLGKLDEITFDLAGDTFVCRKSVPGAVILDFVSATEENSSKAAGRILSFFDHALEGDELVRWNKLIVDPDVSIEMETITEVVAWLIEEYTARPTEESK